MDLYSITSLLYGVAFLGRAAGIDSASSCGISSVEREDDGRVGAGTVMSMDDPVDLNALFGDEGAEVECEVEPADVLEAVDVGDAALASAREPFGSPKGRLVWIWVRECLLSVTVFGVEASCGGDTETDILILAFVGSSACVNLSSAI